MTARSEWIEVPAQSKTFGPFRMVYLRSKKGAEGAHLVQFPDGRDVRVLPDGHNSGQKRSRTIQEALITLSESRTNPTTTIRIESGLEQGRRKQVEVAPLDPVAYLVGVLAQAGIGWERADELRDVTPEEWFTRWYDEQGVERPDLAAKDLLEELATDGWELARKGEK